jgi:hypothetical protein
MDPEPSGGSEEVKNSLPMLGFKPRLVQALTLSMYGLRYTGYCEAASKINQL